MKCNRMAARFQQERTHPAPPAALARGPPTPRRPLFFARAPAMANTKWHHGRARHDPPMDPKWNPAALMALGAGLTVFSYVTSNWYGLLAVTMGMTIGGLVLASGVVLAFIQTFRD